MEANLFKELNLPLDRDIFLRNLLRELSGTLEEVIGKEEASGFISIVGQHIGEWINDEYKNTLKTDSLSFEQICNTLVDLKQRINGDFYIISADKDKIVLGNRSCPFGDKVIDRSSLCMMTSNVFGTITAENNGYAKVALHETIATGKPECRIVVHLTNNEISDEDQGREYFKS
ncbi:MAG: transcriptional regulator [Proteobacteria bacterium]|nr:transcriptional regulator [Pseudomonadota bacterium]NOG60008.1 transcriptional regulator [Pseudomonadota bacterium]